MIESSARSLRLRIDSDLVAHGRYHLLSATRYALHLKLVNAVKRSVRGACLDVGAGLGPYKGLILKHAESYASLDLPGGRARPDIEADVQDLRGVAESSFDSVLCANVLEHVQDPIRALAEIQRVLRPGGVLLLAVPHLSRLHDRPQDYWRFTEYGVRELSRVAGLNVESVERAGGLFGFLAHQASTVLLLAFWRVPFFKWLILYLNALFLVWPAVLLDSIVDRRGIFACGYLAVATKHDVKAGLS